MSSRHLRFMTAKLNYWWPPWLPRLFFSLSSLFNNGNFILPGALAWSWYSFFFFPLLNFGAGCWTQVLASAKNTLYHWTTLATHEVSFFYFSHLVSDPSANPVSFTFQIYPTSKSPYYLWCTSHVLLSQLLHYLVVGLLMGPGSTSFSVSIASMII